MLLKKVLFLGYSTRKAQDSPRESLTESEGDQEKAQPAKVSAKKPTGKLDRGHRGRLNQRR